MEKTKSPKKALKRGRPKNISKPIVADSEDSDNESPAPDYNGINSTLHENDDNLSDGGWSSDDDRELVQKVKSKSKQADKVSYKTRLKQINWSDIAFKSYTPEECEKRFQNHLKHVRRYRNLNEIATDIETNIKKCPIKKPLNSYQLFIQDQLMNVKSSGDFSETMKNLGTLYKELPSEERGIYEHRALQLRLEYKEKKIEFDSGNMTNMTIISKTPSNKAKTPFMLYADSKKLEESDYSILRENYANLSIDEKYKWVIKAVSEAHDKSQENISKILNKEEQRIYKGQIKTTPTAYSLFVKQMYNKIKDEQPDNKNVFTEIARLWKSLDPKKKQEFINEAAVLKERALKEQDAFNERHGMTPQKRPRRKSTFIERVPEDESDHEEEKSKRKKQKTSVSSSSDETKQIQMKSPTKSKTVTKPKTPAKLNTPTKSNSPKPNATQVVQSPEKIQSPIRTEQVNEVETEKKKKKKKKEKLNSESSELNEKSESDAGHSSSSSSSKKKSKKENKTETIEPPGNKPPGDFETYFAKCIHTGKPHKAKKAFDKLPKKERKQLMAEYREKVQTYMDRLGVYLKTLPKEEAVAYIYKVKQAEEAENRDEQDANGSSSQEY